MPLLGIKKHKETKVTSVGRYGEVMLEPIREIEKFDHLLNTMKTLHTLNKHSLLHHWSSEDDGEKKVLGFGLNNKIEKEGKKC